MNIRQVIQKLEQIRQVNGDDIIVNVSVEIDPDPYPTYDKEAESALIDFEDGQVYIRAKEEI